MSNRFLHLSTVLLVGPICLSGFLAALADPRGVEVVPQQPVNGVQFKHYYNQEAGVDFLIPANWAVHEKPDKDTLMKASAGMGASLNGEVSLSRFADSDATAKKEVSGVIESKYLSTLDGYKKLGDQNLVFGSARLEGLGQIFTAAMNGINIWQRRVYFGGGDGKLVVLAFTCPPQQSQYLLPISNNILASIKKLSAGTSESGLPAHGGSSAFSTYEAKAAGVSFVYPSDWTIEDTHESNLEVKITGNGGNGKRGEISLHTAEQAYLSPEDVGRAIEADTLKSPDIKSYSQVRVENQSFGTSLNLPAFVSECTFEYRGLPARQIAGFFKEGDRHYILSVRGVNWSSNEMRSLFSRVSSSIKLTNN